jgi:tetraprenyl-beta-curcumene synthase
MTAHTATNRIALAAAFLRAARRYWLSVFPRIWRETRHWRERAQRIADPALCALALEAHCGKRGNVEGSAAFAAFVPRTHRASVVRAQVAFQSIYDYADTLAEQDNDDPLANSRQLHQALLVAIDPSATHPRYYAHDAHHSDDAGYLEEIVDACRFSLANLPSRPPISAPARRITERIVAYQSLNLRESQGGHRHLEQWARRETPPGTGLRWWETAASAGSSLGLFALIAAAARPQLTAAEAMAIEGAYWPWIGALHSLLDSLVDEPEDTAAGQRSLLHYYASREEAAARLQLLAAEARRALGSLPNAREHTLILAGMATHYLSAPEASSPAWLLASRGVLETLGAIAKPSMLVMRARRTAGRMARSRIPDTAHRQ